MKAITSQGCRSAVYAVATLSVAIVATVIDAGVLFGIVHVLHAGVSASVLAVVLAGNLALASRVAVRHARQPAASTLFVSR